MPVRLRIAGFAISVPRAFEANTLYDTPEQELRKNGRIVRLRQVGDRNVITWKGPGVPGRHKVRTELETSIGSLPIMNQILENLGYKAQFRYEKFRTEFRQNESLEGVVTLDETPIGDFLELEGSGGWIDATAATLGFGGDQYVLESYVGLYLSDCARRHVEPSDMVFAS